VSCLRLEDEVSDWLHFNRGIQQGCTVAPSLFLLPVDWVLERIGGFLGVILGTETFTGLDYADDVLIAEMLYLL